MQSAGYDPADARGDLGRAGCGRARARRRRPGCLRALLPPLLRTRRGWPGGSGRRLSRRGLQRPRAELHVGILVAPPPELQPACNAWDYVRPRELPPAGIYDPATTGDRQPHGRNPRRGGERPERARGGHPLCSFAAVGPDAARIVAGQVPDDVYAPLRGLAESEGYLMLLGVGLGSATLLHLAEEGAGRTLLRRWARNAGGEIRMVPVAAARNGFDAFAPLLAPVARETAWARARGSPIRRRRRSRSRSTRCSERPASTHCADPACVLCADSIAGGRCSVSARRRSTRRSATARSRPSGRRRPPSRSPSVPGRRG